MQPTDRNFDELADAFGRNIYDTDKGRLRLELLWDDLQLVPGATGEPVLEVLDAGAGMGQMALRLAQQGNRLTLCDVSEKLLGQARQLFDAAGLEADFIHAPVQSLGQEPVQQYDLVVSHAVLEWLADPRQTLSGMLGLLKPGGWLSLMFFNRTALEFRHLQCGNFTRVFNGELAGDGSNLVPTNPLDPPEVCDWLQQAGMEIVSKRGIRVLHDYLVPKVQGRMALEDMLKVERRFSAQEPYLWLGRYFHVLCRKPV